MKTIGIIFAVKEEMDAFKELADVSKEYTLFDLSFYEAIINNNRCIMTLCGVGKVNAARSTQILIDNYNVDMIFNIGVAGGIANFLHIGDIVIGKSLVQHDFDITAFNHEKGYIPNVGTMIDSDEYLLRITQDTIKSRDFDVYSGVIASGDIFCTDIKMSEKIYNKFKALCVEMEGASVAQVAYLSHVPFLVIRCISDIPNNDNNITYEEFLVMSSKRIGDALIKIINRI